MYEFGKTYYDLLFQSDEKGEIKKLIPTFLAIANRKRDELTTGDTLQSPEEMLEILSWTMVLYQIIGDTDSAYDTSLQIGDVFFTFGKEFLTGTHLMGKEEKWDRGLTLYNNAIEVYQQIRLDSMALEKIFALKLDRIDRLIDIGRHAEGLEEVAGLIDYYSSQPKEIVPYSKEELSLKSSEILGNKSIEAARAKQFVVADMLMKPTKDGFESAGKYTRITPYLWQLASVYDELDQNNLFLTLTDSAFDTALKYNDNKIQQTIFTYLEKRAKDICGDILGSRLLMVKKGSIEFYNNTGVQYLLKAMDCAKKIDNNEIPDKILEFLFEYGQSMYEKKLRKRSLIYFEFCATNWWNLPKGSSKTRDVIGYLETKFSDLLTEGKFDNAATHIGSIITIKTSIEDTESAGISAFSFAQAAGQQSKQEFELEFLERAYDAFTSAKATMKLQEMYSYIIQRSDPLFNLEPKSEARREKLIQLGEQVSSAISEETQGEFLQATTFKALNTGLLDLGISTADRAFEVQKNYDPQLAADLYFKVGSLILENNKEKAIEFITKSTKFAVEHEPLKEVIERNISYLQEYILTNEELSMKSFLVKKLEIISEMVDRIGKFHEFLLIFTQNLAEQVAQPNFFAEMKKFLARTFDEFQSQDSNHPKLEEIITWTNSHIREAYPAEAHAQVYELTLLNLSFYEKVNKPQEFRPFFWEVFNTFLSVENFSYAINLLKQTTLFLDRMKQPKEIQKELTEKAISDLHRSVKPKIAEEKFDDVWNIIQELFSILESTKLLSEAGNLYEVNARLFAPHRLDLALTMWKKIIEVVKDPEILTNVSKSISNDFIPMYLEKGAPPAVNQLYELAVEANKAISNTTGVHNAILQAAKFNLSLGEFEKVQEWGKKGFQEASDTKNEDMLLEFANMFFSVGSGLLADEPEIGVDLVKTASDQLRGYGPSGFDYYCIKMAEIYENLYSSPLTQQVAQNEREKILKHFKDSGKRKEEGDFLLTTARISFNAENNNDGLNQISHATTIFKEIEDKDGLSDVVSLCLKTASKFRIGTSEYEALSSHAASVQETTTVELSDEKTQEAFGDLFDGLLDDMTSLLDPKEREKRKKGKK